MNKITLEKRKEETENYYTMKHKRDEYMNSPDLSERQGINYYY